MVLVSDQAFELVRRGFAALNRHDLDALLEICDPDIEWRPMRASRQATVYRGHEGVRQALADIAEDFEELRNDPREVTMVGETVVITGRLVAQERATGVRVDRPAAWLCSLKGERLLRLQAFPDAGSALAAAGNPAPAGA